MKQKHAHVFALVPHLISSQLSTTPGGFPPLNSHLILIEKPFANRNNAFAVRMELVAGLERCFKYPYRNKKISSKLFKKISSQISYKTLAHFALKNGRERKRAIKQYLIKKN